MVQTKESNKIGDRSSVVKKESVSTRNALPEEARETTVVGKGIRK